MGINLSLSKRSAGEYLSLVAAVVAVVSACVYYSYEAGLNALDMGVVGLLAVIAVCNLAHCCVRVRLRFDVMGLVELVSVALSAVCLTQYLRSDINNLADLLNGVTIFSGGSGDVNTIFLIIGCLVVLALVQMVACFLPKPKAE